MSHRMFHVLIRPNMSKKDHVLALFVFLVIQLCLLHNFSGTNQSLIYPRWYDQVQYLTESYQGFESRGEAGSLSSFKGTLTNVSPQGALHDLWAVMMFNIAGPSRNSALLVNLAWYSLLQLAIFCMLVSVTGRTEIAWLSVGLLMALQGPWLPVSASVIDFRLDWAASCSFGIALCVAVATKGFGSTGWSILFGMAVAITILTRTLTVVYFAGIFAISLPLLLCTRDRWQRCARWSLALAAALMSTGPVLWHNRSVIYNYYWIGQIAGPERPLRDSHLGVLESIRWLMNELVFNTIGVPALSLFSLAIILLVLVRNVKAVESRHLLTGVSSGRAATLTIVLFLIIPGAVLVAHPTKASQPVTILIGPAVCLVPIIFWMFTKRVRTCGVVFLSATTLVCCLIIHISFLQDWRIDKTVASDCARINSLVDYIFYRSEESGLSKPRVAVTGNSDAISVGVFNVLGYERHLSWLGIEQTLPTGLLPAARDTILAQLGASDFVCLISEKYAKPVWPFDRQMEEMGPELRTWCESNLKHIADFELSGLTVSTFERQGSRLSRDLKLVSWHQLLESNLRSSTSPVAAPPAAPLFPRSSHSALWPARANATTKVSAAYSPLTYYSLDLPEGLTLDPRSGTIRGSFPRPGSYTVKIAARNARGATAMDVTFTVEKERFLATISLPSRAILGEFAKATFLAYDADKTLNYIDISDLTTGELIARIEAGDTERESWKGEHRLSLNKLGSHLLHFRFVRFDASLKDPYSFIDRTGEITVAPQ